MAHDEGSLEPAEHLVPLLPRLGLLLLYEVIDAFLNMLLLLEL